MKYKFVLLSLYLLSFIYFVYKTLVTVTMVNANTGAFYEKKQLVLFTFFSIVYIILAFSSSVLLRRYPTKGPRANLALFLTSALLAISVVLSSFFVPVPSEMNNHLFQLVLNIASVLLIVFMVAYALLYLINFEMHPVIYIIPLTYWLTKLITEYIKIAKMPFIMENGFKIITTAFVAIFYLYFAKYQSRVLSKYSHKTLMFFGFSASALCECFALPQIFLFIRSGYPIVDGAQIIRTNIFEMIFYAVTGLFILVYIHSVFSNRNLVKHRRHSDGRLILPIDSDGVSGSDDLNDNDISE